MSYLEEKARMIRERGARDRATRGKSGFWQEMRVIPMAARILAGLVYVGTALCILYFMNAQPEHWRNWADIQKILFAVFIPLVAVAWVLLLGYINGDAHRRGMSRVLWTLLAIFVPNLIGILLYFLLRDPLPAPCPACGTHTFGSFVFCPHCGSELAPACPNCKRAVERGWSHCAQCGATLPAEKQ